MATLTLNEVKTYLRVIGSQDDTVIQGLMNSADNYLTTRTKKTKQYTGTVEGEKQYIALAETAMYKQAVLMLVAHWYENRGVNISNTSAARNPIAVIDLIKSIDLAEEYEE